MKVVIQRSKQALVEVEGKIVGKINKGLVLLIGLTHNDTSNEIDYMVKKITNLRIFDDEEGVMNKSIKDIDGEILSISQFTLYGDTKKGNRPSYINAMSGDKAISLYEQFNNKLATTGIKVEKGIFGADMKLTLTNDGPVTIIIEKNNNN